MSQEKFKIFVRTYNEFRNKLFGDINNINKLLFTANSEDCYLIEESWINDYINYFNQNKDNKTLEANISFQNISLILLVILKVL